MRRVPLSLGMTPVEFGALVSNWWDEINESSQWQDGIFYSLCAAYALVSFVALIQLIRIELRVPEYGWTTQKIFHLMNFIVNGVRAVVFGFHKQVFLLHPKVLVWVLLELPGLLFFSTYTLLVLFWAEIYHQARGLPTDKLRIIYILVNGIMYFIQVCTTYSVILLRIIYIPEKLQVSWSRLFWFVYIFNADLNRPSQLIVTSCLMRHTSHYSNRQAWHISLSISYFLEQNETCCWISNLNNCFPKLRIWLQFFIWIYIWIDDNSAVEMIGKIFIAAVSFVAALGFLIYGGRLFVMLRRFPIESKGRRKKLREVGSVTAICFTCFLTRCFIVFLSAFDTDASLDVMDHPVLDLIYYVLVEVLPSALVLYILRKLPPKRISAQYHPIR